MCHSDEKGGKKRRKNTNSSVEPSLVSTRMLMLKSLLNKAFLNVKGFVWSVLLEKFFGMNKAHCRNKPEVVYTNR